MKKKIALVCTVWSAEFSTFFCEYSLASLLAENNIPWTRDHYEVTLLLYTTRPDLDRMQLNPNFQQVAQLCKIRTILLDSLPAAASHGHWLQWQHSIVTFGELFFAFVLIIPDCVYANGCLQNIARALEENDLVYYSLPQVCLELIQPYFDGELRPGGDQNSHRSLDLSGSDVASLFAKYANPKHAVATCRPDYFITHPEYLLQLHHGSLKITELACHPLAVRAGLRALSYTFNPVSASHKVTFLGILGVSCEYTLKFIEQYFRWPCLRMELSRCITLASWAFTFREQGAKVYAGTEVEVRLAGLEALSVERKAVTSPRVKYVNCMLSYQETLFAVYSAAARLCPDEIRRCIALAMCLPGFRKRVMSKSGPWTVFLPISFNPPTMLSSLLDSGDPSTLFSFLLMHVVPERLTLKPGHAFTLAQPVPFRQETRFRTFDRLLTTHLSHAITGTLVSDPVHVNDSIIIYTATMHYGS